MKNVLLILGLSLLMFGCGKDSNNNSGGGTVVAPVGVNGYQGTCQVGQVQTVYGCLPQGTCPVGQAQYGNTCVSASVNNMNCQGSCQPGMVQTQWGCYPANASCGSCGALVGNHCVQGYSSGYGSNYGYGGGVGYPYGGYYNTGYYGNNNSRCTWGGWYWYCY